MQHLRRRRHVGKRGDPGELLLYQGARVEDVRGVREDQVDPGDTGDRVGVERPHALDPAQEEVLHRDGDQRLHLRGGQAEALGLDLHRRRPELRQHIHAGLVQVHCPQDRQQGSHRYHQQPEADAACD